MNYYLIWTEEGWLRTPTYNHAICSGAFDLHLRGVSTLNTTKDIESAKSYVKRLKGKFRLLKRTVID